MLRTLSITLLAACAAAPRAPSPSPSPTPNPNPNPNPNPTPNPNPNPSPTPATATASAPADVPRFARLDVDPEKTFPLRAKLRHAGPLYLAHDAPPASTGDGRWVLLPVTVIDGDTGGTPRRPRLVCDEGDARVAVYMDARDLGTVALSGAVIEPSPGPAPAPDAPGVHLAAGALIDADATGDPAHVHYKGLFLTADGVVPRDHVDVVYTPDPEATAPATDGKLLGNVELRASPGGAIVARIAKQKGISNELYVQRLGAPKRGFVKIRYDEDDAYAIGWVPQRAVKAIPSDDGGEYGGMVGNGTGGPSPSVKLARGTLLADPASDAIVGVVTSDAAFECRGDCAGPAPRVAVDACAGTVELRARRAR